MKAWFNVFKLGLIYKIPAKMAALFVVPFLSPSSRINNDVFGVMDAIDLSWYNIAVRNGAHNLFNVPIEPFFQNGNTVDMTLEKVKGFQWRSRVSHSGKYVSFRMTWGVPRNKGKYEFYIGWVPNPDGSSMRLSFLQLRMKWHSWLLAALIVYSIYVVI